MGLLLLPVARNSLLTAAFGIAWEQVLFVHTWLGGCFLACGVTHAVLWWIVYAEVTRALSRKACGMRPRGEEGVH